MGTYEWNCPQCTFLHKFPSQRCTMCGSLRVTREQMREFVRGGSISAAGNTVNARAGADGAGDGSDSNRDGSIISRQTASSKSNTQSGQVQNNVPMNPYNRPTSRNSGSKSNNLRPNSSGVKNPYARPSFVGHNTSNTKNNRESIAALPNPVPQHTTASRPNGITSIKPINPYANRNNANNSSVGKVQNHDRQTDRLNTSTSSNRNGTNQDSGQTSQNRNTQFQNNRQTARNGTNSNGKSNQDSMNRQMASSTGSSHNVWREHFTAQNAQNGINQNQSNRQSVPNGLSLNQNDPKERDQNQLNAQAVFNGSNQNAQNSMNQIQSSRQAVSTDFNPYAQSSMNQNHRNRQTMPCEFNNQNQSANVQGLKEKPIAPLFKPQGAASTSSRINSVAKVNTSQSSAAKNHRNRDLPYREGPVPLSSSTRHNWIYPIDDKYPERSYQLQMAETSIMTNTLVSLPTGLGKTLIAAVVMYNYYRWFPTGKVVFCAPTRPLVTQQIEACYNIMGIPEHDTAEISGRSKPEARRKIWHEKRVFFCTPHTLVKDIEENRCDATKIVCVVMDEAHRATGAHANAQLVSLIKDTGAKFRLVGLSATPGTDIKSIQKIITTLKICQIEAKTENDPDVKQYIHNREEEVIYVSQPDAVARLDKKFGELMKGLVDRLHHENVGIGSIQNSSSLKSYTVLKAKEMYIARCGDHRLDGYFAALITFADIRNKLHTHGVLTVRAALQNLNTYGKPGLLGKMIKANEFQSLLKAVTSATHATQDDDQEAEEDLMKNNPKYAKLNEILLDHFGRKQAAGKDTRAIIFSQWRDSVEGIVSMLRAQNNDMIKPSPFIGQSKKSGSKTAQSDVKSRGGQDLAGMNQAQQQKVLEQFRLGFYNILVCTCVAEEGLDIGDVDLIVNFDVLKSPIRSIQRSGRTGRKRDGRVVCLVSVGAEKKSHEQSELNRKKIARALQSNKSTFEFCIDSPMFPSDPTLVRQKMTKSKFRMSQIGGHTPKARNLKASSKTKASNADWILNASQENSRHQKFGHLSELSSNYILNGRAFPQYLRREYLKSRDRSVSTQMYRKDGRSDSSGSTTGCCVRILKRFEKKYLLVRKTLSLSPLDEALANLQSSQKSVADCVSLNDDCVSMHNSESSVVQSVQYARPDVFPYDESRCERNQLDDIFGHSKSNQRAEILEKKWRNILFDSSQNRAVPPPPWCNISVSTDSDSDDNSSLSVQTKSSHLSVNKMNDGLLRDSFGRERAPVVLEHSELANVPEDLVDNADLEGNCTLTTKSPFRTSCESTALASRTACLVQSSDVSTTNGECRFDEDRVEIGDNAKREIISNLHGHQNTENSFEDKAAHSDHDPTSICALQLPTPPDSSDDSDIESASDNYQSVLEEVHRDANEAQSHYPDLFQIQDNSMGTLEVEDRDVPFIAPLQLPTQFSDSSSDDESDEDATLGCHQVNDDNDKVQESSSMTTSKDRCIDTNPPDENKQLCEEFATDENDARSDLANFCEMQDENDQELFSDVKDDGNVEVRVHDIVPLRLPTQEWSSSSDDESNCSHPSPRNNSMFRDKENDNDSYTKMPPPSSLKNITNIAHNRNDEQADSLTSQNDDKVAAANMSSDDLTDTPVGQRLISFCPRLSDGLTDTPLKTIEDSGVPTRKRLRTLGRADMNQTSLGGLSNGLTDTPLKTTETNKRPKKLAAHLKRLRPASGDKENRQGDTVKLVNREERVKRRIEEKYRCRFLDTEAAWDGSGEDSDEEDAVKDIEEDESNNSFINDSSQLGYTQDELDQLNADGEVKEAHAYPDDSLLHRQFNHERNVAEQFKTPVFNRRMMRNSLSQNAHSSQRGLGNMNFIKSVLEHHRQGGDSDDIENEYHRFAEMDSSRFSSANSPISIADSPAKPLSQEIVFQTSQQCKNDPPVPSNMPIDIARHSDQNIISKQPVTLTAEQKAMIESKRVAALKRRQERIQQQQPIALPQMRMNLSPNDGRK